MDPLISGNKLYKLHYFIQSAIEMGLHKIVTMGGAYSNHLAATAVFCRQNGLKCAGIVRGEENKQTPSPTLHLCQSNGMELFFVERAQYAATDETLASGITQNQLGSFLFIPEGGYDSQGAQGASIMADQIAHLNPTHICMAVGTATTLAGFCTNLSTTKAAIIGIPVLKGMTDIHERVEFLSNNQPINHPIIFNQYHFGGYAKYQSALINFMNLFYHQTGIPTDFVYTGKMMYAVNELLSENYFPPDSRIVCIHTGGLQGNKSLPKNLLDF